jgi:predicted patatin/cPLA2 family phospholipase
VALVLSGGGTNGVLMELGILQRIRESEYWPRVGWIFGTSAGCEPRLRYQLFVVFAVRGRGR